MVKLAYKTEDGKVFETSKEAVKHEASLNFVAWYESKPLFGGDTRVDDLDLLEWLNEHREIVKLIVEGD